MNQCFGEEIGGRILETPYALLTSDRKMIRVSPEFWHSSPVLNRLPPNQHHFKIFVPQWTVVALDHVYNERTFPKTLMAIFDVMALAKRLELKRHLELCFDFFCTGTVPVIGHRRKKISECAFPRECSESTIVQVARMLFESPVRKDNVYESYLKTLEVTTSNRQLLRFVNLLKEQRVSQQCLQNKVGLPCNFNELEIMVAVVRRGDTKYVAVLREGVYVLVSLPGLDFSRVNSEEISDFFLVYDQYIVYRDSSQRVFFENIEKQTPPVKVYDSVVQFYARKEHLIIMNVDPESQSSEICKWNGKNFIQLDTRGTVGMRFDFNLRSRQLCYEDESLQLLRVDWLNDFSLHPYSVIHVGLGIRYFAFYKNMVYVFTDLLSIRFNADSTYVVGSDQVTAIGADISDSRDEENGFFAKVPTGWRVFVRGERQNLPMGESIEAINSVSLNPYLTASL